MVGEDSRVSKNMITKPNPSKQKFEAEYQNKKFKSESGFKRWLNQVGRYIISFQDHRQDCLEWVIDEGGEVLHANLQSRIWNGTLVDLSLLKIGKGIAVLDVPNQCSKRYDFIVRSIVDTYEL